MEASLVDAAHRNRDAFNPVQDSRILIQAVFNCGLRRFSWLLKKHPLRQRHIQNLGKDQVERSDFRDYDGYPGHEFADGHMRTRPRQISNDDGHEYDGAHEKAEDRHEKHPKKK